MTYLPVVLRRCDVSRVCAFAGCRLLCSCGQDLSASHTHMAKTDGAYDRLLLGTITTLCSQYAWVGIYVLCVESLSDWLLSSQNHTFVYYQIDR